jgi:predicted Zn-dependent peptidase
MSSRLIPIPAGLAFCLLLPAPAMSQGVTLPDYERVELENGTVLLLNEQHDVPLIAVSAILWGGAVSDPPEQYGVAALLASLLEKGAGERDALQFAEAVDSVGGRLSAGAGLESITITGDFLARDANLMVELLADMLLRPTLDADELTKLRERAINFIRVGKDTNLNALLPIYGHAFLFGEHPYGNPVGGSETTLANITHADVVDYYEQQVGADRLIISVSGDFDTAGMRAKLEAAFGEWRPAAGQLVDVAASEQQSGSRVLLVDKPDATQTYFWIANIGVARDFEQRAALSLANTVFGGRLTSMLNEALRVRSGLTYGARSQLQRPSKPGSLAITSFTRTDATVEAIDMALGVLGQLRDGGIDDDAVASAQNYMLGQFPTGLETAAQIAAQLAALEAYGLDASYINNYGAEIMAVDVPAVAAVVEAIYPTAENLVFVLIGDAELIRESVSQYGPVTEMPITEPGFHPK